MDTTKEKLTIQQVAEATGLSSHTLRYYERIGLIHSIGREDNTHRRYTTDDIGWIEFLTKLRAIGMPIQKMLIYAELQRQGESTLPQRVTMLRELKADVEAHMAELRKNLDTICWKIDIYQGIIDEQSR